MRTRKDCTKQWVDEEPVEMETWVYYAEKPTRVVGLAVWESGPGCTVHAIEVDGKDQLMNEIPAGLFHPDSLDNVTLALPGLAPGEPIIITTSGPVQRVAVEFDE
jgi:hypothetical protein